MWVIAINGVALAGKDTFANIVTEYASTFIGEKVATISTIDPIKTLYTQMGWNGEKTPEHRAALHELKMFWKHKLNGPHNWVKQQILDYSKSGYAMLFVMVREYEEMIDILTLGKNHAYGSISLEIFRDGLDIPPIEQAFLDSIPQHFKYDYSVFNRTTSDKNFTDLRKAAVLFWNTLHRR